MDYPDGECVVGVNHQEAPVLDRPIRTVLVDDEVPARTRLRGLLDGTDVRVVGEADSVRAAIATIRTHSPDLIFLDIKMSDGSGFDVLNALDRGSRDDGSQPLVVFVTAFDAYAIRAFESQALDYLLKPFDDRRFEHALHRARASIRRRRLEVHPNTPTGRPSIPETLAVRAAGRVRLVAIDDIDWVEAAGTYVRLHTGDRSLLLRRPLGALEQRLSHHPFVRIHRSTLVRFERIREIRSVARGDGLVVLADGTELRFSRTYRERFERLLV